MSLYNYNYWEYANFKDLQNLKDILIVHLKKIKNIEDYDEDYIFYIFSKFLYTFSSHSIFEPENLKNTDWDIYSNYLIKKEKF